MGTLSKMIILIALISVGFVLFLGLLNMARGGSPNMSQRLMRWRVVLQFIAIVILMTAIYFASHS
jgi:hypothetical protein